MTRVILSNLQPRLGDSLMMTSVIRDFKLTYPDIELGVITARPEIYENNPHVDCVNPGDTAGAEVHLLGPGKVTNGSKTNGLHIAESFRVALESKSEYRPHPGRIIPDIHMSESEKNNPLVLGDYWAINPAHGDGYASKQWVIERWQKLVESMPHITFVQIEDSKSSETTLTGSNVINMVGKTNIRGLFNLIYHSQGVISLISAPMHIAGAFGKPAVIIAGAREPRTYEGYENQQHINNIGCLPCAKKYACWAGNKDACFVKMYNAGIDLGVDDSAPDFNIRIFADEHKKKSHIPRCMDLITVDMVAGAIHQHYQGGALKLSDIRKTAPMRKPVFRMVGPARIFGGAERSMIQIMKMMQDEGYLVEFAARGNSYNPKITQALPDGIKLTDDITSECDILMLYASDMVWDFDKPEFDIFDRLQAKRKVMALTYKLGKVLESSAMWTKGGYWDKYLFLSTEMKNKFLEKKGYEDTGDTVVLPPPVDLSEFYKIEVDYNRSIRIARHSSQGDNKYDKRLVEIVRNCAGHEFLFMPKPSCLNKRRGVYYWEYNEITVKEFLVCANVFWYLLPEGYTDQGPRVIMEAMAAGLPIITENRSGMADRVNEATGWFVTHENCAELINSLTYDTIKKKGEAARAYAKENFDPHNWVKEIIG